MAADNEPPTAKKPSKRLIVWLSIIGTGFLSAAGAGIYQWVSTAVPDGPPLAASLSVDYPDCEGLVVDSSLALPERDEFTPEWAYEKGGATSSNNGLVLTIQGTSDQAVVLHGFDVLEVEREDLPDDPHLVSMCKPFGGPLDVRYLALDFAEEAPVLVARPGGDEEAVDFPYSVSKSEPEYFLIEFADTELECLCSWQLGVRWTSGSQSGTLIVDRGFGKIRTAFATGAPFLYWEEGGVPASDW